MGHHISSSNALIQREMRGGDAHRSRRRQRRRYRRQRRRRRGRRRRFGSRRGSRDGGIEVGGNPPEPAVLCLEAEALLEALLESTEVDAALEELRPGVEVGDAFEPGRAVGSAQALEGEASSRWLVKCEPRGNAAPAAVRLGRRLPRAPSRRRSKRTGAPVYTDRRRQAGRHRTAAGRADRGRSRGCRPRHGGCRDGRRPPAVLIPREDSTR